MLGSFVLLSVCLCLEVPGVAAIPCDGDSCAADDSPPSLLQLRPGNSLLKAPCPDYEPMDVKGKSVYFVVVDSFGGEPAGQSPMAPCGGNGDFDANERYWCNGTIKGVTENLDYIQGMGFECVWITPVLKQFYGPDPDGVSGYGYYGYWAYNWYEIDPSYGTKEDLIELSDELHKRGMCFIYDIVLNHVGPVHSTADVESIVPFNKVEYFHTYKIGNLSFDQYAKGKAYGGQGYPPPVQGIGPGAMCPEAIGCDTYKCPVDPGFGNPCPTDPTYIGEDAPGPDTIPYCGVGDLVCEDYNVYQTLVGWFYDLGDLNQSVPFVRDELTRWGKYMANTYKIDAFRLDTAPYVSPDFLSHFQKEVNIPILGEVTASNWTFFKGFSPKDGAVLKGLLNFYLQNAATSGFCGSFFPYAKLNLSYLAANTDMELNSGELYDLELLGNFVDNHDMQRLSAACNNNMARMNNALAWTMLAKGMPIIYYGTELYLEKVHPPFWPYGYNTSEPGYLFLQLLNSVRKQYGLGKADMKVQHADQQQFVFTRGDVWVFLNNLNETNSNVSYKAAPSEGEWEDILSGGGKANIVDGKYEASSAEPRVLVPVSSP